MTLLQTESGKKEQIHCRRRLDGKTKAVNGLAVQKALAIRFNPRHFGGTPKHRGAEESDIGALLMVDIGLLRGSRGVFVVPIICRSNPEEFY